MTRQRTLKIRIPSAFVLFLAVLTVLIPFAAPAQQADTGQLPAKSSAASVPADQAKILDSYGKLPLSFEANHGQTDARVKFLSRTSGYSLFLTDDEAVLTSRGSEAETNKAKLAGTAHTSPSGMAAPKAGVVLRMKLRNANLAAKVTGMDKLVGTSNYFIGNDPKRWRSNVPTYAKVKYEGIYSGIDLVYYGNQRQLEYDFIVAPGADPHRIAFDVRGAKRIRTDAHGDLVLKLGGGEVRWHKPVVYQEKDGARREVAARYSITHTNRVAFELASYDASRPLYIDPLIYSTFLGGSTYLDAGNGIAVDSAGNAYVTGGTTSHVFPVTSGAYQTSSDGNEDAFVSKISPDGSALIYSTYLGNSNWNWGAGIVVDSAGDAYVVGGTLSPTFPTTPGAFKTTCNSEKRYGEYFCVYGNAFVTMLNPTGSALVYSTYLGDCNGLWEKFGIALDNAGNAYVIGSTAATDFPVTPGAFQTVCNSCTGYPYYETNAFVSKLNPSGAALVYSTYLGGSGSGAPYYIGDYGEGIAVDSAGSAYITGDTSSTNFPVTPGAFQTNLGGGAFVSKISPDGSALIYSTYLGGVVGFNTGGNAIAVDSAGDAYVTGSTDSSDFPTTPGAFQTVPSGTPCCASNAFVTKFNPSGTALVYSTYLGGSGGAVGGESIAIDIWGDAYVTGWAGPGFPLKNALQVTGGAFVTKFNPTGSTLAYSTHLGGNGQGQPDGNGIAVDASGNAYVTGLTGPSNFPITPGAFQATCSGNFCPFVSKVQNIAATTTTLRSSLTPSIYGQEVTWMATVTVFGTVPATGTVNFTWDGNSIGGAALNAGGVATLTRSLLNADSYPLTAVYEGDANNSSSKSAILNQVVTETTSAATLSSSTNPSTQGQAVTFTATITSPTVTATGPVTFTAGRTVLGTAQLSDHKATFTTSTLAVGSTTVKATYNGDSNIAESSASVTQRVQN